MSLKIKIMIRAVRTRINNGENIDEILETYPKLTEAEKQEIRDNL